MSIQMRSFKGKSILSFVRAGDYAHAGEEEAIEKVFQGIPKDPSRKILDVGCGTGGTAQFIQDHDWGTVTGTDIEEESIEFAKTTYPSLKFYCSDVVRLDNVLPEKYDLICLFNSFYAFPDQEAALRALRKVSHDKTILILFDYIDLSQGNSSIIIRNNPGKTNLPINQISFNKMALKTGWHPTSFEDLSKDYKRWYESLLEKIEKSKDRIIEKFSKDGYNSAQKRYTDLLHAIKQGEISGAIIRLKTITLADN